MDLSRFSLEEKVAVVTGAGWGADIAVCALEEVSKEFQPLRSIRSQLTV